MHLLKQPRSYIKRKCPNNCSMGFATELFNLLANDMKYCPSCGAEIIEETVNYDVHLCSHCTNVVNEKWRYCPYCGEKKE